MKDSIFLCIDFFQTFKKIGTNFIFIDKEMNDACHNFINAQTALTKQTINWLEIKNKK